MSSTAEFITSEAFTSWQSMSAPESYDSRGPGFLPPLAPRLSERQLLQRLLDAQVCVRVPVPTFPHSPPPEEDAGGLDDCDGAGPSKPSRRPEHHYFAATSLAAHFLGHGRRLQEAGKYTFSDANKSDGKGQVKFSPTTGLLSLTDGTGEPFTKIHQGWIIVAGKRVGEYFSLQSTSNEDLYLAVNTAPNENYVVKGMRLSELKDETDCFWTYVWFSKVDGSDKETPYIALQYWGDSLGPPDEANYYFVIELKSKVPFKIAPKKVAAKYGRLGLNT